MPNNSEVGGPLAGRLDPISLKKNFSELHPPLDSHEAAVAADRCYFCYDCVCIFPYLFHMIKYGILINNV